MTFSGHAHRIHSRFEPPIIYTHTLSVIYTYSLPPPLLLYIYTLNLGYRTDHPRTAVRLSYAAPTVFCVLMTSF